MGRTTPLIFDGHNDVLLQLYRAGGVCAAEEIYNRSGHINVERARIGGFGGGFFAIYIPSPEDSEDPTDVASADLSNLPLPEEIPYETALPIAMEQAAILLKLQEIGVLTICTSVTQIRDTMASGKMAAIMHMEGAEAIDTDLNALDVLYSAGLRSLGPVWSRPTVFGEGVPFRFPSSADIGGGLTDHGVRLVRRCNELGVLVDLSHLNEAGFWDVARISDAPLVATHSNVHALCQSSRNLTDRQLDAIRDSDGMVGLNFAVAFLREDGVQDTATPLTEMLRHIDYLIDRVGEDRVGLGSDYDGAAVPDQVADCGDLPNLRQAMMDHGYGGDLIQKICQDNWLRVLQVTWKS